MTKLRVGILGATGTVGQRMLQLLEDHPQFAVTALAASDRSQGKPYAEACAWRLPGDFPPSARRLVVQAPEPPLDCDVVFSSLPTEVAGPVETRFARGGYPVVSNSAAHRLDDEVPLLIPEVNPEHLALLDACRGRGRGFIVTNPNCSAVMIALALTPLAQRFGVSAVVVTTLQALSGAGYPGVASLDIVDNVVPFIPKEEEKVARETRKIFATLGEGGLREAEIVVSATCTRAAVLEGHTESVSVSTEKPTTPAEVAAAMRAFDGGQGLPSAPKRWIIVHDDPFRPQPRLDRDAEAGMATSVGRIRADPVLENGIKFVLVSHNAKMGAAKGAVLVAEHLSQQGFV
jgi:aspartate-semialdehyde dehydrogenase